MTFADAAARRLARTRFVEPVVLVAGAGTGKTSTLVARVVAWSVGDGWQRHAVDGRSQSDIAAAVFEGITAITFTERAAAEMGKRIADALEEIRCGGTPHGDPLEGLGLADDVARERCSALLVRIDALRVDTIHAFCRRVLAGNALDAGLHPSFRIDGEGRIVPAMIEETLARWIDGAYGDPGDADALALLEAGHGPEAIASALTTLVLSGLPPRELERDAFEPEAVRTFACREADALRPFAALLHRTLDPAGGRLGNARKGLDFLDRFLATMDSADRAHTLTTAVDDPEFETALKTFRKWRKSFGKNEAERFLGVEDEICERSRDAVTRLEHIADLDPDRHARARRVLGPLLAEVREDMTRQGVVTFDDLLHRTAMLLTTSTDARRRIRAGMDQLLVDEVQDTDPVQYRIISAIALQGDAGDRPGLFVVGDPKQSIYGFRSADLAAFDEFLSLVRSHDGHVESLTVNFRSTPEILDEVGRVIGAVMIEEPGVQPRFEALVPGKEFADDRRRPVAYRPVGPRDDGSARSSDEARRVEADAVAEAILSEHAAGALWGDMAILMRVATDQETYLAALREREIPYVVERDRSYFRRREIIDAISTVAAIADPHDHLSLVAFLRSPAVGLPDAALLPLWGSGFPGLVSQLDEPRDDLLEQLEEMVSDAATSIAALPGMNSMPSWPLAVSAALRGLAEMRVSLRSDPVDEFTARLRRTFRQEETEACRFLGSHRLANLERFYRRLQNDLSAERRGGLHAILREHKRGVNEAFEEPESAPGDETLQAVRVMTIHRAKGLDFDQVFLVDSHHRSGGGRQSDDDVGRIGDVWETRVLGASSLEFDAIRRRRASIEGAELVRTLYVAMTRAKTRLVVSGKWPTKPGTAAHADLVATTRMPPPTLVGAVAEETGDGVSWQLVTPTDEKAGPRDGKPRAAAIDVDAALSDARRIARDAIAGREREQAPLVQSVTGVVEGEEEGRARSAPATLAPEIARVVGTAMHALLELRDSGRKLADGLDVAERLLEETLRGQPLEAAREELRSLVKRGEHSDWLKRLESLEKSVIGREVPIILRRDGDVTTVISGAIDLLYRDPETDEVVVADYKTDRPGAGFVADQAQLHEPQLKLYADAVQSALGLDAPPRKEVWFLGEDAIVTV